MASEDWDRIEKIRQLQVGMTGTKCFHSTPKRMRGTSSLGSVFWRETTRPILKISYAPVTVRSADDWIWFVAMMRRAPIKIPHRWQQTNPVTTEALIQLTLGAPQLIYNGGLLMSRLRYFDFDRKRPGLPKDTAALVETLEAKSDGGAVGQS